MMYHNAKFHAFIRKLTIDVIFFSIAYNVFCVL